MMSQDTAVALLREKVETQLGRNPAQSNYKLLYSSASDRWFD